MSTCRCPALPERPDTIERLDVFYASRDGASPPVLAPGIEGGHFAIDEGGLRIEYEHEGVRHTVRYEAQPRLAQ